MSTNSEAQKHWLPSPQFCRSNDTARLSSAQGCPSLGSRCVSDRVVISGSGENRAPSSICGSLIQTPCIPAGCQEVLLSILGTFGCLPLCDNDGTLNPSLVLHLQLFLACPAGKKRSGSKKLLWLHQVHLENLCVVIYPQQRAIYGFVLSLIWEGNF